VVSDDEHDLAEVICNADLEPILSRLAAYAKKRLRWVGWFNGTKRTTHRMSPMDLVNLAIDRSLARQRHWRKASSYPDLESFLRGVIRSLLSSAVKAASRDQADFDDAGVVEPVSDDPSPEDETISAERREVVAAVACCAQDDEDLSAYYRTVLEGHAKPADIATALDWDVKRVSAARIKLQRRLTKKHPELFANAKKRRGS
jgi:hypothetical protein